ncbi:hypothetical protein OUZ56_025440 [Daphnia magna]|uniref:Uncharacterized protein n=1 Tax=Daphnia magna TaxID=35525 RepID=A0ABQ9ZJV5_9CRUS|nr:hypothetical protein OUZ56_025440 [Daphnia magna]
MLPSLIVMATNVSIFMSSSSDIIKSNSEMLEKFYFKCKKRKSSSKSQIPFDELCWTSFTITMICSVLTPMDLYKYLVEFGFIDNSVSSYCLQYSGQLTLIPSTTVIDGGQLKCNNRIGVNVPEGVLKEIFKGQIIQLLGCC